jgi:tetratricopeptide (TPR) repeat protein
VTLFTSFEFGGYNSLMKLRTPFPKNVMVAIAILAFIFCCAAAARCQEPVTPDAQKAGQLGHKAFQLATQQKRYDEAIELLKQAVALDPKNQWLLNMLANVYIHKDSCRDALPYVTRALSLDPTSIETVENMSFCYANLNQSQRLLDVCLPCLAIHGKDPAAAHIWMRVAHAHALCHQYKESYAAYDHYFDFIADNADDWFSACRDFEDPAAAKYMYPLYCEYQKRFPADKNLSYVAYKVRLMTQLARADSSAAKSDSFDELLLYKDPRSARVSKEFFGMAKEGLRAIPSYLWQPLINFGCKIVLTPYTAEVKGEGIEKCPRGYKKGSTYLNVPGVYLVDKKFITIAEYYIKDDGKPTHNDLVADTVCHELGHAYDAYLGSVTDNTSSKYYRHFSHGKQFCDAYAKDATTIPAIVRLDLAYYLQPDDKAGQEELFAELFPIIFDQSAIPGSKDNLLERSFPETLALIASTLHVKWPPEKPSVNSPKTANQKPKDTAKQRSKQPAKQKSN